MKKQRLNIETSWDDGKETDTILADMLYKHKMPGIFYFTSHCEMANRIGDLVDLGFEIGGHTMTHPMDLKLCTDEELDWEIGSNKKWLELQGAKVSKFCYPRGRYDDRAIEVLKKYKFKSARTTKVLHIHKEADPYRQNTTIHIYPREEYKGRPWMEMAKEYAALASLENGVFHLWGHSWEIDRNNEWNNLDEFLGWLNNNFDIWKL